MPPEAIFFGMAFVFPPRLNSTFSESSSNFLVRLEASFVLAVELDFVLVRLVGV
jgi:hypothetical protein